MSTSGWVSDLNYVSDDASYMEAILAGPLLSLFFTCSLSTLAFSILIRPFVTRHGHTSWTRKQEEDRSKLNTTFVTLFVLYLSYLAGSGRSGLQQIIKGTDPKLNQLLDITPILRAGPSPPFWLSNRHIQFIPWMLQNELHRVGLLGGSLNMEYVRRSEACARERSECKRSHAREEVAGAARAKRLLVRSGTSGT
jgi:hypothetical protein